MLINNFAQQNFFSVIGHSYREQLYKLYNSIQKLFLQDIWSIREQEINKILQWVISSTAANYYLPGFYNWLKSSKYLQYKESLSLSEKKQISQLEIPITIFESQLTPPYKLRVSLRTKTLNNPIDI